MYTHMTCCAIHTAGSIGRHCLLRDSRFLCCSWYSIHWAERTKKTTKEVHNTLCVCERTRGYYKGISSLWASEINHKTWVSINHKHEYLHEPNMGLRRCTCRLSSVFSWQVSRKVLGCMLERWNACFMVPTHAHCLLWRMPSPEFWPCDPAHPQQPDPYSKKIIRATWIVAGFLETE